MDPRIWIYGILVWIRICGSMHLTNGSGSTPKCHGSATLLDPCFGPDPDTQIRTTDIGIRIYVRIQFLNNAILKCEDLIKNIQMAYNFVTLLIYPLYFFFKGVFNFAIYKSIFKLKKNILSLSFLNKNFIRPLKIHKNFNIGGGDEITHRVGNFVTPTKKNSPRWWHRPKKALLSPRPIFV